MPNPALARQVRAALENAPDALPLTDLLAAVDDFVLECTASADRDALIAQFEEELQSVHHEVVDYASLTQAEVFLAVLYHLRPVLPAISVVSWFDLVLRPALREPKLPTQAVNHAKELIVSALRGVRDGCSQRVEGFTRRLFELWLLDAFNEASVGDILEWAALPDEERVRRTHWKSNLEDTLRRFAVEQPEDFLDEIDSHFQTPTTRRQLVDLFLDFMNTSNFSSVARTIPHHPFMQSLQYCLFFDNSSTVCSTALSLLARLLPHLAVNAPNDLRTLLPHLFAILVRIMLWKERPDTGDGFENDPDADRDFERELESEANRVLKVAPGIKWDRLEMTFDNTSADPPNSRAFFTVLYYLYPSNVLKFLRNPVQYLFEAGLESPYVEHWDQVLTPADEIRRNAENLLREHCSHPLVIWRDAVREISEPEFWRRYDLARIVSESNMLDIRNLAAAVNARVEEREELGTLKPRKVVPLQDPDARPQPTFLRPIDLSSEKVVISLQDMINTTIALKSNLDVEVILPSSQWPRTVLQHPFQAGANHSPSSLVVDGQDQGEEAQVAQAIAGLQREILLLRNDLNFELYLSRESSKHIGRLYQDRILMKTAEVERQGLYNKLRKYRSQVISLENELREHRQQASTAKNKNADWNTELQKKLKELREEKKNWQFEVSALRSAEKESRALFEAQKKLLADATNRVFELETQRKENQHKVDRLRDYERQIEQHLKVQRLWDGDFAKFNDRAEEIEAMKSQCKQMQLALDSMTQTQTEMDDAARNYRRQIQTLEAQLKQEKQRTERSWKVPEQQLSAFVAEKRQLLESNKALKEENDELKEELEEMRAMVELLKGQMSGTGLISVPVL